MLLMIDNYDSFTYNLVQYLRELGEEVVVYRNDKITLSEIEELRPERLVVSPGPCTPNEAGISVPVIKHFSGRLGHQSIGQAYGGRIVRADRLMHGKTSPVFHDNRELFAGLPNPFDATRYHSLLIERVSMPDCLEITAWTAEGEIMGLRHRELAVWGVQFHPESILTVNGMDVLRNFLQVTS